MVSFLKKNKQSHAYVCARCNGGGMMDMADQMGVDAGIGGGFKKALKV